MFVKKLKYWLKSFLATNMKPGIHLGSTQGQDYIRLLQSTEGGSPSWAFLIPSHRFHFALTGSQSEAVAVVRCGKKKFKNKAWSPKANENSKSLSFSVKKK